MMRNVVTLGAILSIALVAAGCGGGSDAEDSAGSDKASAGGKEQAAQIDVKSGELKFAEEAVTVEAGTVTLRSENPDSVEHNIAIEGEGVSEQGELVKDGATSEITVDLKPGEYEYFCTPHRAVGMTGKLTVT